MLVLEAALALLCLWSAPHCRAASQRSLVQMDINSGNLLGELHGGTITVDSHVQHPATVGAVLAHESQHAIDPPNITCAEDEARAYAAQKGFLTWYITTQGPIYGFLTWSDLGVLGGADNPQVEASCRIRL